MNCPIFWTEYRFTEWIEAMRKDVECTFGILKGRLRVLKTGIRLHGIHVTDCIWMTCCALHNMFLEEAGLQDAWENGQSVWETELGNHDDEDVISNVPARLLQHFDNPAEFNLSGMGPGTDQHWPDHQETKTDHHEVEERSENNNNSGEHMDIDYNENIINENGDIEYDNENNENN
jgi:Plant transposon protein